MTASDMPHTEGFEAFAPGVTPAGIVVLRASRLEAMVPQLCRFLALMPPDHVLAPHTVIAAHAGMRQWLLGALAHAAGKESIVANIDVLLASEWIATESKRLLGQQAIQLPKHQPAHLRWRILEILDAPLGAGMTDARLTRYLEPVAADQAGEVALRKFQLADRLARIYSQYMLYRPNWLEAWQSGYHSFAATRANETWQHTERDLLAPLWQTLRRDAGAHRGEVTGALIEALSRDSTGPRHPLHVFGVSHLAPNELAALKTAALHRIVVFHVPDPCREYWAGLRQTSVPSLHDALTRERKDVEAAGPDDLWHQQMHPMLAQWGRMGREFLLQLTEGSDRILVDIRHNKDDAGILPKNRLQRVQESIRQDEIALLESAEDLEEDASLRIHACHTRVRELEVVRDAIFDAIDRSKDSDHPLMPSEIAVVAPDIGAYAALIPGVFGAEADRKVWPPYAISDNSTRAAHALFAAFGAWLAMPGTRMTANQIINLLAQPAIARAYKLDASATTRIGEWLAKSRATWGLDAAHRGGFGVPEGSTQNSLTWAADRLMAGFIFGNVAHPDAHTVYRLPQGLLAPAEDIHGPEADALAALCALLNDLRALNDLCTQTHNATEWVRTLEDLMERSLRADPNDSEEKKAMTQLRTILHSLEEETLAAEASPSLHFNVVRNVLEAALESAPSKGRFLRGGITFAGMVPQRAVPFRFIAVLGLNEGEFPRQTRDAGLDLMSQVRALGDRDVRNDDRWLFLETLMSAREQLHLSFLGQSASKGDVLNPATPLAELDGLLLQAWQKLRPEFRGNKEHEKAAPWRVVHALQPFATRYFDRLDPRYFSYDEAFAGMVGTPEAADLEALVAVGGQTSAMAALSSLSLQQVLAYYKDPAKFIFHTHLNASLEGLTQEMLSEHEPLDAKFEAFDSVGREVFLKDVVPSRSVPEHAPAWLKASGIMPPGDAGQQAWSTTQTVLNSAWLQVAPFVAPFMAPEMKPRAVGVSLALDAVTQLEGVIRSAWTNDDGQWLLLHYKDKGGNALVKPKDFTFKETVPLFLEWASLRLALPDKDTIYCVLPHEESDAIWMLDRINGWSSRFKATDLPTRVAMKADLRERLAQLVHWAQEATHSPLAYFPKTSTQALGGGNAADTWRGSEDRPGESSYSLYARLIGRGQDFASNSLAHAILEERAKALHALIELAGAE